MKAISVSIALALVAITLLPILINAGEEPRRIVEKTPKKILVFGSFLTGRK
jgi:archaellum biogenesis protein FlaJ (TadC family)